MFETIRRTSLVASTCAALLFLAGPPGLSAQEADSVDSPLPSAVASGPHPVLELPDFPEQLIWGRTVKLEMRLGSEVGGELLAVEGDFLWVQTGAGPIRLGLDEVIRARVERHRWGGGRMVAFVGIGAALTAAGMHSACSQVADNCSGVAPAMVLSWALIGGLSGFLIASSRHKAIPLDPAALAPYARYPQGRPTTSFTRPN